MEASYREVKMLQVTPAAEIREDYMGEDNQDIITITEESEELSGLDDVAG